MNVKDKETKRDRKIDKEIDSNKVNRKIKIYLKAERKIRKTRTRKIRRTKENTLPLDKFQPNNSSNDT